MRYRVLRSPYVVVRARPSTSAPIIGQKFAGATFHATNSAGGWVRITGGPNLGWVLADGRDAEASDTEARKFGRLLLPLSTSGSIGASTKLAIGLPPELLPLVLECCHVRDILALRSACRACRVATSSAALWLELAQRQWNALAAVHNDGSCARPPPPPLPSATYVLPLAMGGSVVDACARLVPWPSCMTVGDATSDIHASGGDEARCRCTTALHFVAPPPPRQRIATPFAPAPMPLLPRYTTRIAVADVAYPHTARDRPRAPLPFATIEAPAHQPHLGWRLRTSAYFEVVLHSGLPTGGSLYVGICDGTIRAGDLNRPLDGGGGHAILWRLDGPPTSSLPPLEELPPGIADAIAPWAHATDAPMSMLLHADGPSLAPASTSVPSGALKGDTIGCGIDYAAGRVFFTRNGKELKQSVDVGGERGGVACLLHAPFRACIAAAGDIEVHVQLMSGSPAEPPLAYDLSAHDARAWAVARDGYGQKRFFEEQARLTNMPLAEDESMRGWPWVHHGWAAHFEKWVTPWLRREAAQRGGARAARSADPPTALPETDMLSLAVDGDDCEACQPKMMRPADSDPPIALPLWPEPDVLSLTPEDRSELHEFVARAGLQDAVSAALTALGLSLARLAQLRIDRVHRLLMHAQPTVNTGARLRLRSALQCEVGTQLDVLPPDTSPLPVAPSSLVSGRRVWYLAQPCLMVVLAAPGLPVRERPDPAASACATRHLGDLVIVVAESSGWVEVRAQHDPRSHPNGWMLWDGRLCGHAGPLLCPLRLADEVVLSARRHAWPPCAYPRGRRTDDGEWACILTSTLPCAASAAAATSAAAPPSSSPPPVSSPSLLSELATIGADVEALARLARQDRAALQESLKALGYARVGARLHVQKALLESPSLNAAIMPSAADALRKRRDEREMAILLQLAGLPMTHAPGLLAAGVSVRMMAASSLVDIDAAAAACTALRNEERIFLLEAAHTHIHRRVSRLDEDVRRILRGAESETLAAALAKAAPAEASETEGVVAVARAVGGDEEGSVAAYDKVGDALIAAMSRLR